MFEDALRYPWKGDDNVARIAIGGIILLVGAFIPFVGWIIGGYGVDVIRRVSGGDEDPPSFGNYGKLFVDGLKATIVGFVYQIPAFVAGILGVVLFFLFVAGGAAAGGEGGGAAALLGLLAMMLFFGIAGILYLLALLATPAGIALFARSDSLGTAFSLGKLRSLTFDGSYLKGLVVAFAVGIVISIVISVVGATVIGVLLYPFLYFYGTVASAYAIGRGVRAAA